MQQTDYPDEWLDAVMAAPWGARAVLDAVVPLIRADDQLQIKALERAVVELHEALLEIDQPEDSHELDDDGYLGEPHLPSYWIGDDTAGRAADAAVREGDGR